MKKRFLLFCLAFILLFTTSCGILGSGRKQKEEKEETVEAKAEEPEETPKPTPEPTPEPEEEEEPEPEPTPEPKPTPKPVKEEPALYTEDFKKVTNYDLFNNEKNSVDGNDLSGNLLLLEGVVDSYTDDRNALILKTDDGDWAVSCGGGASDRYYDMAKSCIGKQVRVFCGYVGYSDTHKLPLVSFCPTEFTDIAYRLETPDNNFRLTYPDTYFEMPEFKNERAIGNITFREPEGWTLDADDSDPDQTLLIYSPDWDAPEILMVEYVALPKDSREGMTEEELLSKVTEEFAGKGNALRERPFKLLGTTATCFEMTMQEDGMPCPVDLFSYILVDDHGFYYFGVGEPYLVGESNKQFLADLSKTFRFGEGDTLTAKADVSSEKEDASGDEKKKEKEETKEEPKEDTKKEEKTDTKAKGIPTRSELSGKTFSQYLEGDFFYNGETTHQAEEIGPAIFGSADLQSYNESNGTLVFSMDDGGMKMIINVKFSYDAKGKIVYSGPATASFDDGAGTVGTFKGTCSGHEY